MAIWLKKYRKCDSMLGLGFQSSSHLYLARRVNTQYTFHAVVNYAVQTSYLLKAFASHNETFPVFSGPCVPNPCHNGGTCEISEAYRGDTFIGYVCKCPRGFNGIHCQHSKSFLPSKKFSGDGSEACAPLQFPCVLRICQQPGAWHLANASPLPLMHHAGN